MLKDKCEAKLTPNLFHPRLPRTLQMEEMLLFACQSFAPATSKYMTREGAKAQRLAAANAITAKVGPGGEDEGTAEVKGYEGGVGLDEFAGVLKRGRMI